jgi:hypothetical protein
MAFKGTDTLFAVKEYSHKKLERQKSFCAEIHRNSSLHQAVKKACFTGILTDGCKQKGVKMYANLSSKCTINQCETIKQIRDEISPGVVQGPYCHAGGLFCV